MKSGGRFVSVLFNIGDFFVCFLFCLIFSFVAVVCWGFFVVILLLLLCVLSKTGINFQRFGPNVRC